MGCGVLRQELGRCGRTTGSGHRPRQCWHVGLTRAPLKCWQWGLTMGGAWGIASLFLLLFEKSKTKLFQNKVY